MAKYENYGKGGGKNSKPVGSDKRRSGSNTASDVTTESLNVGGETPMPKGMHRVAPREGSAA